ncbi:hypothetical protein ABZX85_11235 [Streptomyces sp. NPDC004539]|uniref:hypothetical protein n=1 Tax=Streptomyces sp. NPDC004539 TaxID=3154280 RepID=UPI0033B22A85
MRRITGRAVRTALAALAVTATLALPLAVAQQSAPEQSRQAVAADPLDALRKPTDPNGDDKGSWVWDDQE